MSSYITACPLTHCDICDQKMDYFYEEKNREEIKQRLCQHCFSANKGGFPKGRGCYKPCPLCKDSKINWYYVAAYGKQQKDCGEHEEADDYGVGLFD